MADADIGSIYPTKIPGYDAGVSPVNPTAIYISGTPTSPTDGTLWVVKGSSPLLMKIYDSATSTWKTIGA